jgi:hypothetical protein
MVLRKGLRAFALVVALVITTSAAGDELPVDSAAKPSRKEIDALLASTDEIAKLVSEIRGLPIKKPISRGALSRDEITRRMVENVDKEYKPEEVEAEARAWKRLGLLPADMDYKQVVVDLLAEQVGGFYDPETKELYIADWIEPVAQRIVMAHEIDHALQDQSFDLDSFVKPFKDNGDLQLARQALVEGDGVALMIEFLFHDKGIKRDPWADDSVIKMIGAVSSVGGGEKLSAAPMILREQLMFPYDHGLRFVASVRKLQPWSEIDAIFKKPPTTTEQIMHPEKYAKGEGARPVKAADLPSLKGWKRSYDNVLGEAMWDIFLRQHGVADAQAEAAAAGWGGDKLVVYAPPSKDGPAPLQDLVAVSLSTWDAELDAIEAFDAVADAAGALAGGSAPTEDTETARAWLDDRGDVIVVERKGNALLLLVGAPAKDAAKLRADVWKRWKK